MEDKLVITFDFGTQSVRCMIINQKGEILAQDKEKYTPAYYSTKIGYAEQSFEKYYEYACIASKKVKEMAPDLFDKAIAVSTTTFRDTFTTCDKDGNPTRDFILWLDSRRAECKDKLPFFQRFLFKLVGMQYCVKAQRGLCRQSWIKENERELWDRSDKFASIQAIFYNKMTGNFVESEAACIGHVPHNTKKGGWDKKNSLTYPIYALSPDKLLDLKPTLSIIGYITKECSIDMGLKEGLPLIAGAADKACELAGSGVKDDKAIGLSFGTAVSIEYLCDKYIEPDPFFPAYPCLDTKKYISEIQIYRGCWMLTWFIENFCDKEEKEAIEKSISPERVLSSHLKDVPIGAQGLILVPYWNPPLNKPEARGTIMGFLPDHNKYYIYRAILEGIGYTLYKDYLNLEKRTKHHSEYVVISGGASIDDEVCQMMADIFGLSVKRPKEYEATSLGCAIGAFVGMGVYKNVTEAIEHMVTYEKEFTPNMENHKLYMEVYNKIYKYIDNGVNPIYRGYYKLPE